MCDFLPELLNHVAATVFGQRFAEIPRNVFHCASFFAPLNSYVFYIMSERYTT